MPITRPQVEPIKKKMLTILFSYSNGGRTGLVVLRVFPIQVPLFLILLWNQVFWKAKLRTVVKKQLTLNAKVLMVNGENHQRQKLMVSASLLRQNR